MHQDLKINGDLSGNTSKFVSMQVDKVTANNWHIKENGDVSGNDASFNNMDIRSIESTNWYIKANGDASANDVSFNSIYVTNDISANKWDIKQNGDISGNDASFNNIYLTGTTFFTGEVTGNDASFNKIRINKICGAEFPVVGEFYTSWSAMGDRLNGTNDNDYFGESMSFNSLGDVVVVGIPDTGSNKGEIKVYRWNGSAWNQAGNTIEGPTNSGYFGRSVDINGVGDIIIVGGKDVDKYGTNRGLVRTYRLTKNYRNDGKWEQFGQDIYGGSNHSYTGSSVTIDKAGNTIAVASYQESGGSYSYNGVVRIYEIDNNSQWILQTSLNGTISYQYTGANPQSLSFNHDATVLAVGAHNSNPNNTSNSGEVRIYKYSGSSWSLSKSFQGWSSVMRGLAVSLNIKGDIGIFNEPYYSSFRGQIYIYRNTTGTNWVQLGSTLQPVSGYSYSYLNSVDINDEGNIVAIGGYGDTINSYETGSVWVYKWSNGTNFTSGSW